MKNIFLYLFIGDTKPFTKRNCVTCQADLLLLEQYAKVGGKKLNIE